MTLLLAGTLLLMSAPVQAQVKSSLEITESQGGFGGTLSGNDFFGTSSVSLGDLDGNGTKEIAVGAIADSDGGPGRGAVWILSLNNDGSVADQQKISDTAGGFGGTLDNADRFGAVAKVGDLDGNSVPDLAVGASGDDDGGSNRGAVWILLLKSDGTVKGQQKISDTQGSFKGGLTNDDRLGVPTAGIGDLDGDNVPDLAVGARFDEDGGTERGAVWILFLNSDGTVKDQQKISASQGSFGGSLDNGDRFGLVENAGDIDGDNVTDLAVGAPDDEDGGSERGAVWILFLNNDGTVRSQQKISDTQGGFEGTLSNEDLFGLPAGVGDLDGNGVPDLVVGAQGDDDGGNNRGAVWTLHLRSDGTVKEEKKISDTQGGLNGSLSDDDEFGFPADLGDINSDGSTDLAVGAPAFEKSSPGSLWVVFGETQLLPVELAAFEGTTMETGVRLRWQTASETNNAGFEVQRRVRGAETQEAEGPAAEEWTEVGFVESKVEGGTTDEPQSYRFADEELPFAADRLAYRLRQVDLDGTSEVTDPVVVERGISELDLRKTFPNPARGEATVQFAVPERQEVTLQMYDVLGRQVRTVQQSETEGRQEMQVDLSGLSSGTYFLRLEAGGQMKTQRLTVVR